MNKKFLSAILFGALMVTSTGTFVSCKDYDDDIENLQTQINSNKDAIAALQKLVGEGNWVTGVTSIANGFTVTMSNGQTTTITAINGVDGKDGVEWTIGEDGFWYKDGEKTDHQAVAKDGEDGKPGVTAPSPSISADGKWVVYEWDATKEEFVATTTEIPAQGTSAYVVKKDGVYVLHIADETGAFQDVTLPATSDSFVVTAPYSDVEIYFEHARWNPTTNTAEYKALVEQYPELKDIAKNALVKQGGYLPVLVTPASVELSDDFSFSLQQVNGKTANVTITNPVKGLHNADFVTDEETGRTTMQTRSVDASACYWTLSVEPAIEKNEYVTLSQKPVALVAENAKGTVVKTEFAYKVLSKSAASEATIADKGSATYASEIDLLAYDEKVKGYPVTITGNYIGYQIITLTNNYQIEKYGLSIVDNRILKIENMPSDVTSITVNLHVVTISLTGTTTKEEVELTIGQEVAATGNLSAQSLTLDGEDQIVKWNLSELGLSALDLDKVLGGDVNVLVLRKYTDDEGEEHAEVVYNGAPKYYNAAGKPTEYKDHAWTNKDGETFGITLNANEKKVSADYPENPKAGEDVYVASPVAAPAEYEVRVVSTENNGNSVIFSAETTLTTELPTISNTFIKLADGFVENGVLQVIGTVNKEDGKVNYTLKDAFVLNGVDIKSFVDMDFDESDLDETSASHYNWISGQSLSVNVWKNKEDFEDEDDWSAAEWNQLYVTRNLSANIYFFDNELNATTYDFKAVVKSAIYSTTPKSVITIDETELVSNYGGAAIDIKEAVTKAVYAAGPQKGQEYTLFSVPGAAAKTDYFTDYKVYSDDEDPTGVQGVKRSGIYAVDENGAPVEIAKADLTKLGMSAAVYAALGTNDKFYITLDKQTVTNNGGETTVAGWTQIMEVVTKYYGYNNKGEWTITKVNSETGKVWTAKEITADGGDTYIALFNAYKAKLAFNKSEAVQLAEVQETPNDDALDGDPTVEFVNEDEALKYVRLSGLTVTPKKVTEITEAPEKVEIPMNLLVKDVWGMTMKVPFTVTIQTTEPEE